MSYDAIVTHGPLFNHLVVTHTDGQEQSQNTLYLLNDKPWSHLVQNIFNTIAKIFTHQKVLPITFNVTGELQSCQGLTTLSAIENFVAREVHLFCKQKRFYYDDPQIRQATQAYCNSQISPEAPIDLSVVIEQLQQVSEYGRGNIGDQWGPNAEKFLHATLQLSHNLPVFAECWKEAIDGWRREPSTPMWDIHTNLKNTIQEQMQEHKAHANAQFYQQMLANMNRF